MPSGKGRSFNPAVNDKLREMAKQLRRQHSSDRAFAKSLRIAQPTVTNFLNGGSAGVQVAMAIARAAGVSICFTGADVRIGAGEREAWSALLGWDDAVGEARRLFPRVSDDAWAWLGSLSGPTVPGLAPAALGMLAGAWDQVDHSQSKATKSGLRTKKAAK